MIAVLGGIRVRAALAIAMVIPCATNACVGIPVKAATVNHIVATSWTPEGKPLALAQKFKIGKTAYVASPEGPGVFEHYRSGPLLLLAGDDEVPIRLGLKDVDIRVEEVAPLAEGGFLVMLDVRPDGDLEHSAWRCLTVNTDGSVIPCRVPPGYKLEAFSYYLSATAHEIRYRRQGSTGSYFESLNVENGTVSEMAADLTRMPLKSNNDIEPPGAPCDMSYSQLAPREDSMVVACTMPTNKGFIAGLWILENTGTPRLLYRSDGLSMNPAAKRYDQRASLEEMVAWPREEFSLAWSPNQEQVFWCALGRQIGVLASSLKDQAAAYSAPCLLLATWSPDGTRLAGVEQGKLRVWDIPTGLLNQGSGVGLPDAGTKR